MAAGKGKSSDSDGTVSVVRIGLIASFQEICCKILSQTSKADGIFSGEEETMATYNPGEKAPDSGELREVGPRGGKVEDGRRVVIERGETIPPTSEAGNQFRYVRGSKTTH